MSTDRIFDKKKIEDKDKMWDCDCIRFLWLAMERSISEKVHWGFHNPINPRFQLGKAD